METRNFLLKISIDGNVSFYDENGAELTGEEIGAIKKMIEAKEITEEIRNEELVRTNNTLKKNLNFLAMNYYDEMKGFVKVNRTTLLRLAVDRWLQTTDLLIDEDDFYME